MLNIESYPKSFSVPCGHESLNNVKLTVSDPIEVKFGETSIIYAFRAKGKKVMNFVRADLFLNNILKTNRSKRNDAEVLAFKKEYEQNKLKTGCKMCGYNKHAAALHFHHIDHSTKLGHVSYFVSLFAKASKKTREAKKEQIRREILKCELLCSNCHTEITTPDKEVYKTSLRDYQTLSEYLINNKRSPDPKMTFDFKPQTLAQLIKWGKETLGEEEFASKIKELSKNQISMISTLFNMKSKYIKNYKSGDNLLDFANTIKTSPSLSKQKTQN